MVSLLTLLCFLADPAPKSRLVVLDLKGRGVNADLTASINDALIAAVRSQAKTYDVLGTSEVATLLGAEQQKQKLGCDTKDTTCLTEIAGALGAERLVTANLDSVGESYFLDVKLLDARHAHVIGESSTTLPHDDGRLLAAVAKAAAEVFGSASPAATEAPTAPTTDLTGWSSRHPEAGRDLGAWVKGHSAMAAILFEWDGHSPARSKELFSWATAHPDETIDAFVAAHPDWRIDNLLEKRAGAMTALLGWARHHPEAVADLMTHPRGLHWVGTHLYAGDWKVPAKRQATDGGPDL